MAQLIVALDYTDALDALNMANSLRGSAKWMKVGLELFTREGPRVVQTLKSMGFKVMLDLKMFDIPNTVRGGVRAATWIGVDMITLHLLGGEHMIREAVEEAHLAAVDREPPMLFGVTVLTSMAQGDLPGYDLNLSTFAGALAEAGERWGLNGVVCSGHEVHDIKARCPHLHCLTPGIRLASDNTDDQHRIMTPGKAVQAGSDYLVVGRPVTRAKDPSAAARAILAEMNSI
ncbi:MAG: orotidine-5'-phosphate decarboxylase [Bilophila sp.]